MAKKKREIPPERVKELEQTIEVKQGPDGPFAECPDCHKDVRVGPSGVRNLIKTHMGTESCDKAAAAYVKAEKLKKQREQFAAFAKSGRPASRPVPSTLPQEIAPVLQQATPASTSKSVAKSGPATPPFIEKLASLIQRVPLSVPEGVDGDRLAFFSRDPALSDNPGISGEELWEEGLNLLMKANIGGWNEDVGMSDMIRRGSKGLDGLLTFVRYFVLERGVPSGLFEGKLSDLVNELEKIAGTENSLTSKSHHTTLF